MHRLLIAVALTSALAGAHVAHAHEGHTHKVMGTVLSIQGEHVQVKTTDGKTVTIMLGPKTSVTRGKDKVAAAAIKVGERISVDAMMQDKTMLMAQTIKLATVTQAR